MQHRSILFLPNGCEELICVLYQSSKGGSPVKRVLVLISLFAISAHAASLYKFNCKAKVKNENVTIKFLVSNLYGKATLEDYPGSEYEPVLVTPKDSPVQQLNENLSFRDVKDTLQIDGDSDGFYSVKLVLYRDRGFTSGFVRAQGDEEFYSKVKCTVTKK